jgi:hypothetical protein
MQYSNLSRVSHSHFHFVDGAINVVESADTPAAFVMLSSLEVPPSFAQMMQRFPHFGLIGPDRSYVHGGENRHRQETDS